MRRTGIIRDVVLVIGFSIVFGVWLYIVVRGLHYVRKADYRVSVADKPGISGEVYSLGGKRYLVILTDESSGHREQYDVDLDQKKVGLADAAWSKYTPFPHGAFVDKAVFGGYSLEQSLTAEWLTAEHDVHIQVTGFPRKLVQAGTLGGDPNIVAHKLMPIGYKTKIILSPRE